MTELTDKELQSFMNVYFEKFDNVTKLTDKEIEALIYSLSDERKKQFIQEQYKTISKELENRFDQLIKLTSFQSAKAFFSSYYEANKDEQSALDIINLSSNFDPNGSFVGNEFIHMINSLGDFYDALVIEIGALKNQIHEAEYIKPSHNFTFSLSKVLKDMFKNDSFKDANSDLDIVLYDEKIFKVQCIKYERPLTTNENTVLKAVYSLYKSGKTSFYISTISDALNDRRSYKAYKDAIKEVLEGLNSNKFIFDAKKSGLTIKDKNGNLYLKSKEEALLQTKKSTVMLKNGKTVERYELMGSSEVNGVPFLFLVLDSIGQNRQIKSNVFNVNNLDITLANNTLLLELQQHISALKAKDMQPITIEKLAENCGRFDLLDVDCSAGTLRVRTKNFRDNIAKILDSFKEKKEVLSWYWVKKGNKIRSIYIEVEPTDKKMKKAIKDYTLKKKYEQVKK